jgi:signal transduction histidine kinase
MDREATQLGHIVNDLLTLARVDTGERPLQTTHVTLDDIVLDSVNSAGALASSHGVELQVGRAEESPIVGDAALIRQLVMILLDNAIKYTPSGGIVTVDVLPEHGRAVLTVRDTGSGIDADELSRVYDRFYRGKAARMSAGGAGLGLSIARWIADAHGARLEIASAPGRGTTVTVGFPLVSVVSPAGS